ncbi:MFS transporter [Novosphingobium sp. TH158]|uniref:MFS transporter n=1 Tax=Novosphingobium sp. TH158 TaxID=2067455 RepID=UPI000C7BD6AC|nr:MFS transporter [Novosphingobium sp. TH158]PLK25510.1 MFS transporter [Novosphingobium sp. TH158]
MSGTTEGALAEWRRYGILPIAAALGYATCVIHIYGLGVFIEPISKEFGWSRTATTIGLTLSTVIQALCAIPIGMAVDRFGPRKLAIVGTLLTCVAFANLSNATGGMTNWYVIWIIMSLASLPIQATIWTSAVASRFHHSRGIALAVTLCGASVALIVFPFLGAELIQMYGWRDAMRIEALIWLAIAWPIVIFLFRGAQDEKRKPEAAGAPAAQPLSGISLLEGLKSTIFLRLLIVALLFTFAMIGLNVHFPLMVKANGFTPVEAAALASLIGWFSIPGRIVTGFMLDRLRASLVGAVAFLLPAIACAILLFGGGSALSIGVAAAFIGFTLGAEVDVLVYLTTRYFGLRNFGGLYGGILAALSVGTAFGPLAASRVFDVWASYDPFLTVTLGMMAFSSLLLASLPRPKAEFQEVRSDG